MLSSQRLIEATFYTQRKILNIWFTNFQFVAKEDIGITWSVSIVNVMQLFPSVWLDVPSTLQKGCVSKKKMTSSPLRILLLI